MGRPLEGHWTPSRSLRKLYTVWPFCYVHLEIIPLWENVMKSEYLMENQDEAVRLDIKTDDDAVRRQAAWLGIGPGARVLDLGCGSGHTSALLHELVQPGGSVVGVDYSDERLAYARESFGTRPNLEFVKKDILTPLDDLGEFDFIWTKFVLEYFKAEAKSLIASLSERLRPDGRLCVLDLDYNCLNHYPMPEVLFSKFAEALAVLERDFNFDPYLGRKLYTYMYDAGYADIRLDLSAHHLIYGQIREQDDYNWIKKVDMLNVRAPQLFDDYPEGFAGFRRDFIDFFRDPRRFTYTPLMMCQGRKPR